MNQEDFKIIITIVSFFLVFGGFGFYAAWDETKKSKVWTLVAEGIYDRVEYGSFEYTTRGGAMVRVTRHHVMEVTVVYFNDGRTCVMEERHDMPFPKGASVRILENGMSRRKIEAAA